MFIRFVERSVVRPTKRCPNGRRTVRKFAVLRCDVCGIEFERRASGVLSVPHHFHSVKCQRESQRKGGQLHAAKEAVFVEHFGVTVPAKSPIVRERMMRTNVLHRGKPWPTQSEDVMKKQRATNVARYGVENVANQPHVKARANSLKACTKRHENMKARGSYKKSKPEDALYDFLCQSFGTHDVVRQVQVPGKRWLIDFYVKSIDVYVQLDGVYWHGLDRPIEEIAQHKTPRDRQIHRKWLTDREQDEWFRAHRQNLVRVTDEQFSTIGVPTSHYLEQI